MSNNHLKVLTLFTYCLDIVVFIIPNFPSVALGLEHLQQFPNTSPYPYKTIILGIAMSFVASAIPQYLSFFWWPPIFPSSLLKERGRYNSPNTMETIPTTTFQPYFLLHICGTHLSYGYWGRYIGVLLQHLLR